MLFRSIDVVKDREVIVRFRRESYVVSFGNEEGFGEEDAYVNRIEERLSRFPDGLMLIESDGRIIGQIELQILHYEGDEIGYVNLFYLVPECRGKGYGKGLLEYAENFFLKYNVREYHLRVSPTNERAVQFYLKSGMSKVKEERHQYVVWRMRKLLNT
ncbi:GNAT family N-acetyltransferase [Paenibacillus aestuarii]|uniref:GNAT family N-acetyltransferase n=1 Tax=Paenibacillus aestuarii TaxID=516965 RepID=A0ABW0KBA9_9BACL|nr:GNAT family N-acetyltransferase [Paenibacillus aestuarii]